MLTIRLSRIGKRNKPMYRLVISEKTRDPYGRALEILGSYNPYTKELIAKKDRINHWLKNGSKMSSTINNLLIEKGIIEGKKVKVTRSKKKGDETESKIITTPKPTVVPQEKPLEKVEEKPIKIEENKEKTEEKAEEKKE
jgi:small subunit ribosomal protein S16